MIQMIWVREKTKKNHLGTVFILAKMDTGIFQKFSIDSKIKWKLRSTENYCRGISDVEKLHNIFKIDFDKAIESDDWIFPYLRLANFLIVKFNFDILFTY